MGFKESNIEREICLAAAKQKSILFRNNVGKAYVGQPEKLSNRDIILRNYRILHAGLCRGSSDRIGWTNVVITPDMIGKSVAVFTAIEAKTGKGRASDTQQNFINNVQRAGGFGVVAKSADEAITALSKNPSV